MHAAVLVNMAIDNKYLNPRDKIGDAGPYHSDIKISILKKNNNKYEMFLGIH